MLLGNINLVAIGPVHLHCLNHALGLQHDSAVGWTAENHLVHEVDAQTNSALRSGRLDILVHRFTKSFLLPYHTHFCISLDPWDLLASGTRWLILRRDVAQHIHTWGLVHRWQCTRCTGALLFVAWSATVARGGTCLPWGSQWQLRLQSVGCSVI